MDAERRERFDHELAAPLPGHERAAPVDTVAEVEGQAFMAAMMQHQTLTSQGG